VRTAEKIAEEKRKFDNDRLEWGKKISIAEDNVRKAKRDLDNKIESAEVGLRSARNKANEINNDIKKKLKIELDNLMLAI